MTEDDLVKLATAKNLCREVAVDEPAAALDLAAAMDTIDRVLAAQRLVQRSQEYSGI